MRILDSPSLQTNIRQQRYREKYHPIKTPITVIRNYYLKNIQLDLLEEKTVEEARLNNDIMYIQVDLHVVPTEVMIDTEQMFL